MVAIHFWFSLQLDGRSARCSISSMVSQLDGLQIDGRSTALARSAHFAASCSFLGVRSTLDRCTCSSPYTRSLLDYRETSSYCWSSSPPLGSLQVGLEIINFKQRLWKRFVSWASRLVVVNSDVVNTDAARWFVGGLSLGYKNECIQIRNMYHPRWSRRALAADRHTSRSPSWTSPISSSPAVRGRRRGTN